MRVNSTFRPVVCNALILGGLRSLIRDGARVLAEVPVEVEGQALVDVLFALANDQREPLSLPAAVALTELALSGMVMLPFHWQIPKGVKWRTMSSLPPVCRQVDDYVTHERPRWAQDDLHFRLLMATDCRDVGAFDMAAFGELHSALIERGAFQRTVSLKDAPYLTMRALESAGALQKGMRHAYILWRHPDVGETRPFDTFLADPNRSLVGRIHGGKRERIELPTHQTARRKRETNARTLKVAAQPKSPHIQNLLDLAASKDAEAAAKYFAALHGGGNTKGFRPSFWLERPTRYPGRSDVDIASLGECWFIAFREWQAHRRAKSYESDSVRTHLCVLADYVLLYLPWWFEKHPESKVRFPETPSDFVRALFAERSSFAAKEAKTEPLPQTLYELLKKRVPSAKQRNVYRITWHKFFQFVLTHFEDSPDFVRPGFQNPIKVDYDQEVAGRPHKTNKIPFSTDIWSLLVDYGQAVEAFGEFLQQLAFQNDRFRQVSNRDLVGGYRCEQWGFVPIFWNRGVLHRVEWIPNLYVLRERRASVPVDGEEGFYVQGERLASTSSQVVTLKLPHLTTVRLLICMVDCGLRGQSVQWLDRRSFDQYAEPVERVAQLYCDQSRRTYYSLYVNTDKMHEPWSNFVSWRARRALLAECRFQDCVVDQWRQREVMYEGRDHTRFDSILPLFRSECGPKPISDSTYDHKWVIFLDGFERFYTSTGRPKLGLLRPSGASKGKRLWQRFRAISTPHACRATYATEADGLLEMEEIAAQLGQSGPRQVSHYQVPHENKLKAKLMALERHRQSAAGSDLPFDAVVAVHPERPDSAVRRAFEADREQAIKDFGFVPGVTLWSLAQLDEGPDALAVLLNSPVSAIAWHSTHVCPVGNLCPKEVIVEVGGLHRCGACPLAAKCIDNLDAIEAKQHYLDERVQLAKYEIGRLVARKASQAEVNIVHREMLLDAKEHTGWRLSAEILRRKQRHLGERRDEYFVSKPELVLKKLKLVTRNATEAEFFILRIQESAEHALLETPQLRARASRCVRLMLAAQGRHREAATYEPEPGRELEVFKSLATTFAAAKGMALPELVDALDAVKSSVSISIDRELALLD